MMNLRIGLVCVAVGLPLVASAQDDVSYRCVSGDLIRRVEITYETGAAVPCEVRYYKDTEAPGQPEVPWRAANESGYCESRAQELVGRLRGWGWDCAESAAAVVTDDTDALSAGEPAQ